MSRELLIRNRQRTRGLNIPLLRRLVRYVLEKEFAVDQFELGFHFVEADEMARVNQQFLDHAGSTDVITFDYGDPADASLHGEVFISVADAVKHAREFQTTWQSELVRYMIHSLLHLRGYEDLQPAARKLMKREENRILKSAGSQFSIQRLGAAHKSKIKIQKS